MSTSEVQFFNIEDGRTDFIYGNSGGTIERLEEGYDQYDSKPYVRDLVTIAIEDGEPDSLSVTRDPNMPLEVSVIAIKGTLESDLFLGPEAFGFEE